jgi:hypothetical protein
MQACHNREPSSVPQECKRDFWWIKKQWSKFLYMELDLHCQTWLHKNSTRVYHDLWDTWQASQTRIILKFLTQLWIYSDAEPGCVQIIQFSNSSLFWVITRRKVVWNRRFENAYLSHRQGTASPWRWTRDVIPKRRFQTTSSRVITQKKEEFSSTAAETYDLAFSCLYFT